MKHTWITLLLLISYCLRAHAGEPPLRFKADGTFRIVQFTDVHYIHNDPRSAVAIERINEVLDAEQPDLVVFTGDIIFGKPAEEGLRTVLNLAAERKIPFGFTFGNHDDEHALSRTSLLEIIQSIPYNRTRKAEGISGASNYTLPIRSSDGTKNAAVLYCLDSHSYSRIPGVGGYDYIKTDQVVWYREQSAAYRAEHANVPVPSLAFFHIPLPEYNQAAADESAALTGTRKEKACAPQLNSGLFAAMKEMGDIQGVFVGHDHDNDYAVYWQGILLAYGRYSGGNTVYNNLSNGARVIELKEGEPGFTTWIRLRGNEVIHRVHCPSDFIKKKE